MSICEYRFYHVWYELSLLISETHTTKRYILLLEMYAKGNVILCEEDWTIIALTRPYKLGPGVVVHPKEVYPIESSIKYKIEDYPVAEERLLETLEGIKKLGKKANFGTLVARMIPMAHQRLTENFLVKGGWKFKEKPMRLSNPQNQDERNRFLEMLTRLRNLFASENSESAEIEEKREWFVYWKGEAETKQPGVKGEADKSKSKNAKDNVKSKPKKKVWFDFSPVEYDFGRPDVQSTVQMDPHEMMESFFTQNEEEEDLESQQAMVEKIALQKFNRIKQDQETRLFAIQSKAERNMRRAQLIESNHEEVQGLISTVVEMVRCGLGNIVSASIAQGQRQGDELAEMVKEIDAGRLTAKLILGGDPGQPDEIVPVDLSVTASRNAQRIYEERKTLLQKEAKTKRATKEVLKKAKALAQKEIRNQKLRLGIRRLAQRKEQWFEKFYWFVSGGRYLVISARDAQQNEALIKKYAHRRDVVLHAQIQGCAFTVIKDLEAKNLKTMRRLMLSNYLKSEGVMEGLRERLSEGETQDQAKPQSETEAIEERQRWEELISQRVELLQPEVPPFYVLLEAATATLGHSKAWAKKIPVEVYWVFGEQVSKKAPSGLFLSTGSFIIYGKKNFVPVHKMEMGFGLLFRVKGEAAKREIQKKEEQKRVWAKESLFGGEESQESNRKWNKYGGQIEVSKGKYWEAIEGMEREVRERREAANPDEQENSDEEDENDNENDESEQAQSEDHAPPSAKYDPVALAKPKEAEDPLSYLESQTVLEQDTKTTRINYKAMARKGEMETALVETKFKKKQRQAIKIKKETKQEKRERKEEAKQKHVEDLKKEENKKVKGSRKLTKRKKAKMKKYLDRFGDESEEENRQRMLLMGFGENYLMNQRKKDFKWNKVEEEEEEVEEEEGEGVVVEGPTHVVMNDRPKVIDSEYYGD